MNSSFNSYQTVTKAILVSCFAFLGASNVSAQQATLPMHVPFTTIADADGNDPTDLTAPLFRRGPGNPLTDKDGNSVTLGQLQEMDGEITISARPGGGTDVSITATNLLPNELYTVWAGYWQDPGHPLGNRIGFGAASVGNLGQDNWAYSDDAGNVSFNVVQEEGPMTIQGAAPAYAPISPIETSPGVFEEHAGYSIGIAYHLEDFDPDPANGWVVPGAGNTWVLQGVSEFPAVPAVPEPSSAMLAMTAVLACGLVRSRRRSR